ncbi:MAG: antibiotic ABC transporter permease [Hamadaea sp.]|uniref:ABC transporter permease n=1 Tax=Hamadaea sp. TaxID=2024425 RepID=UPI0017EDC654|nr:ABC-2 family transporter protein [Hamadaea sp.]NUR71623.1 antibiotic ABC transporter permease [Hamadaea sp.]NUT20187.1 antibiotic ABC transporter permease [Hamadaea sp.]
MKPYRTMARNSMQSTFAFRTAFLMAAVAACFQLVATVALWSALLSNGGSIGGFTLPEMKAYLLMGYVTGWLGNAIGEWVLANRIRDGQVALDLVKPIETQKMMFAQTLGGLPMELIMIVTVGAGFVLVAGPMPGPSNIPLLMLSLVFVMPIRFCIAFLTTQLVFWTQNFHGVSWARNAVGAVLSGSLVPLSLMPTWLQTTAAVLPFASLTSTPALIYLGKVSTPTAYLLIGVQAFWVVALWFLARVAFRAASRQVTVHGG